MKNTDVLSNTGAIFSNSFSKKNGAAVFVCSAILATDTESLSIFVRRPPTTLASTNGSGQSRFRSRRIQSEFDQNISWARAGPRGRFSNRLERVTGGFAMSASAAHTKEITGGERWIDFIKMKLARSTREHMTSGYWPHVDDLSCARANALERHGTHRGRKKGRMEGGSKGGGA